MLTLSKYVLILFMMITGVAESYAQLKVYRIGNAKTEGKQQSSARTHDNKPVTLTLPFWDDFSFSGSQPDTNLWYNSHDVSISKHIGEAPPSLGVATLDGADATGTAYNPNATNTGKTDALTSQLIELSDLSVGDDVYLSFFYQYGGRGEAPDASDSLRLEFLNSDSVWVSVWPGAAGLDESGDFIQVMKRIDDPSYFHSEFQFRFQSFGRQAGPFDVWNIDYVYMNDGRTANNTAYPDRAVSMPLTSLLQTYQAVPYRHFDPQLLESTSVELYSLDTIGNPAQSFTYKIGTEVKSYYEDTIKYTYPDTIRVEGGLAIQPQYDVPPLVIDPFLTAADFDFVADSVELKMVMAFDFNDNKLPPEGDHNFAIFEDIDFRHNDTTQVTHTLSSYYAYDDGTAEFGAGLNRQNDLLAYRYDMVKDTTDHIVAIDIYFPYINQDPDGKPLELMIWSVGSANIPLDELHKQTVYVSRIPGINSFTRYELSKSVPVNGSFFIGYNQKIDSDMAVGLDKNTNSGDKIYFNLEGDWQQNTIVEGSLMMRPVFGSKTNGETPVEPPVDYSVHVFPNPSAGTFRIRGRFQELRVYDIRGVEKNFSLFFENDEAILRLENHPDGIYILQFADHRKLHTIKVMKKDIK